MSAKISYECNLCHRPLTPTGKVNNYQEGWAMLWSGPGGGLPETGATLQPVPVWQDAPIHMCRICIDAIAMFRDADKQAGQCEEES